MLPVHFYGRVEEEEGKEPKWVNTQVWKHLQAYKNIYTHKIALWYSGQVCNACLWCRWSWQCRTTRQSLATWIIRWTPCDCGLHALPTTSISETVSHSHNGSPIQFIWLFFFFWFYYDAVNAYYSKGLQNFSRYNVAYENRFKKLLARMKSSLIFII